MFVAGVLSVLAACGGGDAEPVAAGTSDEPAKPEVVEPAEMAEPVAVEEYPLPTIPSFRERFPRLYDDEGCGITGNIPPLEKLVDLPEYREYLDAFPDEARAYLEAGESIPLEVMDDQSAAAYEALLKSSVDCNARGDTPAFPMEFFGHYGAHFTRGWPETPEVLTDTVTTTPSDEATWSTVGLARNGNQPDAALTVTATLVAADGSELATVDAAGLVQGLRPGEPVPFTLTADVPTDRVASVRWQVTASRAPAQREFMIDVFNVVPLEDGGHSIAAMVKNWGEKSAATPGAVVAFFDTERRVIAVQDLPVVSLETGDQLERIGPDEIGDFYSQSLGPVLGPAWDLSRTYEVWVVGGR